MARVILITGGQRSGKSVYAENRVLQMSSTPVYLATAHAWDDDFRERIRKHQERRGPQWTNIEEEKTIGKFDFTGRVVLIDCITLWLTNLLMDMQDVGLTLERAKSELDRLMQQDATLVFVTNEIGLGGVSDNALQRRFTDLQGAVNQYVAQQADEVVLMISGIAVRIR